MRPEDIWESYKRAIITNMNNVGQLNENEVKQIINFINSKYDKEIPGPVKFIVRRKAKKIEKLDLNDLPDSLRKCTIEELILIIRDAHAKQFLKF